MKAVHVRVCYVDVIKKERKKKKINRGKSTKNNDNKIKTPPILTTDVAFGQLI